MSSVDTLKRIASVDPKLLWTVGLRLNKDKPDKTVSKARKPRNIGRYRQWFEQLDQDRLYILPFRDRRRVIAEYPLDQFTEACKACKLHFFVEGEYSAVVWPRVGQLYPDPVFDPETRTSLGPDKPERKASNVSKRYPKTNGVVRTEPKASTFLRSDQVRTAPYWIRSTVEKATEGRERAELLRRIKWYPDLNVGASPLPRKKLAPLPRIQWVLAGRMLDGTPVYVQAEPKPKTAIQPFAYPCYCPSCLAQGLHINQEMEG